MNFFYIFFILLIITFFLNSFLIKKNLLLDSKKISKHKSFIQNRNKVSIFERACSDERGGSNQQRRVLRISQGLTRVALSLTRSRCTLLHYFHGSERVRSTAAQSLRARFTCALPGVPQARRQA